jgi:hypothetical protein
VTRLLRSPFALAKALIFVAAFASFVLSVSLWFSGSKQAGIFVGIWVPSILSFGNLLFAGRGTPSG